jgi:hypothetical protein
MGDHNKDLALEEDFEPDESHVLAVNQAVAKLAQHDEFIKLGMDDDFVKAVMKAFSGNGPYRAVRKAFCQLLGLPDVSKLTILKLREMDVELAPAGDGDIIPVGPFGYVTPGTSAFVYARRAVLKSLIAALLVVLNADRQAQALAPVDTVDYGAYGTNAADFETAVFSLLSYAMASTGEGLLVGARSGIDGLSSEHSSSIGTLVDDLDPEHSSGIGGLSSEHSSSIGTLGDDLDPEHSSGIDGLSSEHSSSIGTLVVDLGPEHSSGIDGLSSEHSSSIDPLATILALSTARTSTAKIHLKIFIGLDGLSRCDACKTRRPLRRAYHPREYPSILNPSARPSSLFLRLKRNSKFSTLTFRKCLFRTLEHIYFFLCL